MVEEADLSLAVVQAWKVLFFHSFALLHLGFVPRPPPYLLTVHSHNELKSVLKKVSVIVGCSRR